jgi:hypothetical protein
MNYSPEAADGGTTYYLQIPDAGGVSHDTALFVPGKFMNSPALRLILYFHGWTDGRPDLRSCMHRPVTPMPLRQIIADDGRFAFAMPWLGPKSGGYAHVTGSSAAFDAYLDAVVQAINSSTGSPANAAVSPGFQLVLGAHSGGGDALSASIILPSRYIGSVTNVWAFDCFYTDKTSDWISWANTNPRKSLDIYYTDTGQAVNTAPKSKKIDAATGGNVSAALSKVSHDATPKTYMPDLLAAIS